MKRMTLADFPRRYQDQIYAQAKPHSDVSHPLPKRHQASALGGTAKGKDAGLECPVVRFTGYRVRPLDPDNFAGSCKDLLDGLRHAGLISGDEWWRIKFETSQVKVSHATDEYTLIEIITP